MDHRTLLPVDGRPNRSLVIVGLLEHNIDGSLGSDKGSPGSS
jgi:hypothetical protein